MKTYIFNISLEPDEEGWRAFYPPLEHSGASTWGKTQEDARQHIYEVLSMIVEEFLEEGRELPVTRDGDTFAIGTLRSMIELQARWTAADLQRLGLIT